MEGNSEKRMFYKIVGIMGLGWFGTLPFIGTLGLVIAPHARHQVMFFVTRTSHALATFILVNFFLHSASNDMDMSITEPGLQAAVFGHGMPKLQLSSGPLPQDAEEVKGCELQLL